MYVDPRGCGSQRTSHGDRGEMIELVRTNDAVLLNFIEVLLRDAGLGVMIADQNMSVLEGSIGVLPKRLLVSGDDEARAKQILRDAGLEQWIKVKDGPFG